MLTDADGASIQLERLRGVEGDELLALVQEEAVIDFWFATRVGGQQAEWNGPGDDQGQHIVRVDRVDRGTRSSRYPLPLQGQSRGTGPDERGSRLRPR